MKNVTITQLWPLTEWMFEVKIMDYVNEIFSQAPDVAWLIENGYTPKMFKNYSINTEAVEISLEFNVEDEIATFLLLKFPQELTVKDY